MCEWLPCPPGRGAYSRGPTPFRCSDARRLGEFFAQLADENINDLLLGLVRSAIEVVEKHFLRDGDTLSQGEEFEDRVFLAGQVHRLVVDRDNAGIEIDDQLACPGQTEIRASGTIQETPLTRFYSNEAR